MSKSTNIVVVTSILDQLDFRIVAELMAGKIVYYPTLHKEGMLNLKRNNCIIVSYIFIDSLLPDFSFWLKWKDMNIILVAKGLWDFSNFRLFYLNELVHKIIVL